MVRGYAFQFVVAQFIARSESNDSLYYKRKEARVMNHPITNLA